MCASEGGGESVRFTLGLKKSVACGKELEMENVCVCVWGGGGGGGILGFFEG